MQGERRQLIFLPKLGPLKEQEYLSCLSLVPMNVLATAMKSIASTWSCVSASADQHFIPHTVL